jgi:hypothetical protein
MNNVAAVFGALLLTGTLLCAQQPPPRRVLLDVVARPPAAAVAPGERFTVSLDLAPAPKIHVYAPDVVGYKPIAVKVTPQPGVVVRAVTYPKSEPYYYAPLKETVAVYQQPFTVVQELALDASAAGRAAIKGARSLTVQGTLSYQACDDKICYPPRQIPVSWQIPVKESR